MRRPTQDTYIACGMHGKFPVRPHSRPVSMSVEDLPTDAKPSEKDVEGIVKPVVRPQNKGSSFTTTRWELWAFYVYYIVSLWLLDRPSLSIAEADPDLTAPPGQQRPVRFQLRAFSISEPTLPSRL